MRLVLGIRRKSWVRSEIKIVVSEVRARKRVDIKLERQFILILCRCSSICAFSIVTIMQTSNTDMIVT